MRRQTEQNELQIAKTETMVLITISLQASKTSIQITYCIITDCITVIIIVV